MTNKLIAANSYTDQELVDLARQCIAQVLAVGYATDWNGNKVTKERLPELREFIDETEAKISRSKSGLVFTYSRHRRR